MKRKPTSELYTLARAVVERLQNAGFEAYLVGGCVRDMILGREPGDYDVATSAQPHQVEALFDRTIPVGRQFGILVVVFSGAQFQVATFRTESDYKDGRRPDRVAFSNAQADAMRRDFTINGLFYDPVRDEVHDWVGGRADLAARLVRTIGNPTERFDEDHLRLLRAVRFAVELDFEIEDRTLEAIRLLAPQINRISAERIRDELVKIFRPPHAARGLVLLENTGLLREVLPEIAAFTSCEQTPAYHPEGTVFEHVRLMLSMLPPDSPESLAWAVLLHDVGKPRVASKDEVTGEIHCYEHDKVGAQMAEAILTRLRFPRNHIDEIVTAVRYHMQFKNAQQMRKSTIRRIMARPTFKLELELHRLDCLGSHAELDCYNFLVQQAEALANEPVLPPPIVSGRDLIKLGMKPGPAMGALLAEIRERQLEGMFKDRAHALAWAEAKISEARTATNSGDTDPGRDNR